MKKFNVYDFCRFIEDDSYPFYFLTCRNGKMCSDFAMLSSAEFIQRGAQNPKNYYLEQIYS